MAQTGCKCYCSNPPGSFFNCNPAPGSNCQTCCNNAVSKGGYWACNDVIGKDDENGNSISASNNRLPKMRRERYSNINTKNCGTCNRNGMAIQSGMPIYPSSGGAGGFPKLCNPG